MGFDMIVKMTDGLMEQADEVARKKDWLAEMDKDENTIQELILDKSDFEEAIADDEESVGTLASNIKALTAVIKAMDNEVAEQTEQSKAEHEVLVECCCLRSCSGCVGVCQESIEQVLPSGFV